MPGTRSKRQRGGKKDLVEEEEVQTKVDFEFDGDRKADESTETKQSWGVQSRGQILYDYEDGGGGGAISKRPGTDPTKQTAPKKKTKASQGFMYSKKRKLSETGSYNEAGEWSYLE
jgi:hypothetical protein